MESSKDADHSSQTYTELSNVVPLLSVKQETFHIRHGLAEDLTEEGAQSWIEFKPRCPTEKKRGRPKGSKNKKTIALEGATTIQTLPEQPQISPIIPQTPKSTRPPDITEAPLTPNHSSARPTPRRSPRTKKNETVDRPVGTSQDEPAVNSDSDALDTPEPTSKAFSTAALKLLIQLGVEMTRGALSKKERTKVWDEVATKMAEDGFNYSREPCRKKYAKLLSRYKQAKDNNKRSGRAPMLFEFEDTFDDAYSLHDANEIDVDVADSQDQNEPETEKRKRPKGRNVADEELEAKKRFWDRMAAAEEERNKILKDSVEIKRKHAEKLLELEERKFDLLKRKTRRNRDPHTSDEDSG